MDRIKVTVDGNEAAAYVAHKTNEVIAIYPITPSSPMGEFSDQWSSDGQPNIWGSIPHVMEMQSEGGAVAALHGALQGGSLATTFTSSQGLLLMIPNMYKIAGELTPCAIHVAARSVAAQALSIFGDHQDVMAVRQTGWALLASNNVQEVMDLALIAQAATLESRVPFVHFFDGFRTSHEVGKVEQLTMDDMRAMLPDEFVRRHRSRSLSPDRPVLRGTAQNPDVYFQARETVNPYYLAVPTIVQNVMDRFAEIVGRKYQLYEYVGAPDAERVIILMGSGCDVAEETVTHLAAQGEKIGVLKVRLFRPFSAEHFLAALPSTVRTIAVLDRTKEPGATGEPLYQEVVTVLAESLAAGKIAAMPRIVGGRYGLSSKEFTPAMVKAVFDSLSQAQLLNHFTIGINDDLNHTSLAYDPAFSTEDPRTVRALFFGLGADGTVGANKNSIKIIGEDTENYAQGYFVYDSKKSGSITTSHLRFGPRPIHSSYLITRANFVACHQFSFLERVDVLKNADTGAVFLLNSQYGKDEVWDQLPRPVQQEIITKKLQFYVIDGYSVAKETGMGQRINTIMQTCFFAISGVLPRDEAIDAIKKAIKKTYGRRGDAIVQQNFAAVDSTLAHLHQVKVPAQATSTVELRPPVPAQAPAFVQDVLAPMIFGDGDDLPVSKMPVDGTYPTGTAQWEKRNIALEIPEWDEALCIQCGKCVLVCPHAVIRAKIYPSDLLASAPASFKSAEPKWKNFAGLKYSLQVAPEDCTGCALCVEACPAKSKSEAKHRAVNMVPQPAIREREARNWDFFLSLPETPREQLSLTQVKDVQLLQPLFEFSGACAGCGETPYIKLLTQLYGDRTVIANATGCSSIYGGNLPTTPYSFNKDGRGVAWSNSLFEDNAEFGLGLRLSIDKNRGYARELLVRLAAKLPEELVKAILAPQPRGEAAIAAQRQRVAQLKQALTHIDLAEARALLDVADLLVEKAVWIVGGDGWAYDIGYGGLDHVMASGRNVNVLVLDTEVYSNTGGQMSKATPRAAVAKFAASGKARPKKDLALIAMSYPAYVARVAMGFSDAQTLKAFNEAEAFDGPSLIVAYTHCIAHGYDLRHGLDQQKLAVQSGHWPLCRFNPAAAPGQANFVLDSRAPSIPLEQYIYNETRYTMLRQSNPEEAKILLAEAQQDVADRWNQYDAMAKTSAAAAETTATAAKGASVMVDLSTQYLGLKLANPLVVAASPLSKEIPNLRQMEDFGASAIVLYSLFEEQINLESKELDRYLWDGADVSAESTTMYPNLEHYNIGPDAYLEHIRAAKQTVSIPVIGSLNGVSRGGWVSYARELQQAGADALELNVYFIPSEAGASADEIEKLYIDLVKEVRHTVSIPIAVKVGPFFSAFANMAQRLEAAGANGLVIFNRFYQPDFDLDALEVKPALTLSNSSELLLRLHWAAILHGNIHADIAITGGVHTAEDVVKSMMAGANVTMLASALLLHGIEYLRPLRDQLVAWLELHEYESIQQMQGSMSQQNVPNPKAFQRANYMKVLSSYAMK